MSAYAELTRDAADAALELLERAMGGDPRSPAARGTPLHNAWEALEALCNDTCTVVLAGCNPFRADESASEWTDELLDAINEEGPVLVHRWRMRDARETVVCDRTQHLTLHQVELAAARLFEALRDEVRAAGDSCMSLLSEFGGFEALDRLWRRERARILADVFLHAPVIGKTEIELS